MKKVICMILALFMMLFTVCSVVTAEPLPWEAEYAKIIGRIKHTEKTAYILADFDDNGIPDLMVGDDNGITAYTYQNHSIIKTAETKDISIGHMQALKSAQNSVSGITEFIGQQATKMHVETYQILFDNGQPQKKKIATEFNDGTGSFLPTGSDSQIITGCSQKVTDYLSQYLLKPFTMCVLTAEEVRRAPSKNDAVSDLFDRYRFLSSLSDDTASFSAEQRDAIKNAVGKRSFHAFDKISRLGDSELFVQFYTSQNTDQRLYFPETKQFAVVAEENGILAKKSAAEQESALDVAYLSSLKAEEFNASNVYIDYSKTTSFRGIDDYVNYLSAVLSENAKTANENGKKAVSDYMEHAVNRSSRTQLKAKNNVVVVSPDTVSFIAKNAVSCMQRLERLCEFHKLSPGRAPRILPEIVVTNVNPELPLRIEFQKGNSSALENATGIRLMIADNRGIYLTATDLKILEQAHEGFCLEYQTKEDAFSVVFTDKTNETIPYISAPVWFIVPAKSTYSTVMASYQGGTDNWGGQFDPQNKTLEFSTNYSGDYTIVENDITINDIDTLPKEQQEAIRFMVSKGIFSTDKNNRFLPDKSLNRYDFTAALVKMFYATNIDAESSFTDVPKSNEFYRYVASAQEQKIATGYQDNTFRGKNPALKEQVVTLCGRTLAEKKGYAYPEDLTNYLRFTDTNAISDWAKPGIAVAVKCGLIGNTDVFSPSGNVTRAEGASILYKTFMLLYDVSPVTTVSVSSGNENTEQAPSAVQAPKSIDIGFRAAICILLTVTLLFVAYILNKVKKHRKNR